MRTRPSPRSFGGGELAPWLDGITSEVTAKGCRTLENFIVMKQGPITRRPGTFYCAETKDSTKASVLIPVTIDDDNSYVIEAGDAYLRFYKNHAQVSLAAAAYEVTSPWSAGDVTDLRWCYIPDEKAVELTCINGRHAVRKLVWSSSALWTLSVPIIQNTHKTAFGCNAGHIYTTYDNDTFDAASAELYGAYDVFESGAWGDGIYVFVGSANTGAGGGTATVSSDGHTWATNEVMNSGTLHGIAYGIDRFVTVGAGPTSCTVYVSGDGYSWNTLTDTANIPPTLFDVAFDEETKTFMAVGSYYRSYSGDGLAWVKTAIGTSSAVCYATVINSLGECLIVGRGGTGGSIAGTAWFGNSVTGAFTTMVGYQSDYLTAPAYGTPGGSGLWVTGGKYNTGVYNIPRLYTSPTGTVWTSVTLSGASNGTFVEDLYWVADEYIGILTDGKLIRSTDGVAWSIYTHEYLSMHKSSTMARMAVIYGDREEFLTTEDNYPHTLTAHESRLIFAGSDEEPATVYGSKTSEYEDFAIGEFADEAWSYKLASDRNVDIQWVMGGMAGVVVGTRTGEGMLVGSESEGIDRKSVV